MVRQVLAVASVVTFTFAALVALAHQPGHVIKLNGEDASVLNWVPEKYYRVCIASESACIGISPEDGSWLIQYEKSGSASICTTEESLVKVLVAYTGYRVEEFSADYCRKPTPVVGVGFRSRSAGSLVLRKLSAAPSQQCRADAYVGTWQRPGSGKQNAQVQLVFSKEGDEGDAKARGFNRYPYGDGEQILSRIRSTQGSCRFTAKCGPVLSTSPSCTVVIDPSRNTLTVEGGVTFSVSDRTWVRATPAPAQVTCSRDDIEGDWIRNDGALVPIVGVDAFARGDGGTALLFNHPTFWPQGQSKYRNIKRDGGPQSCKMTAICADYDRNASTGAVKRNERACTLTVDPTKRTLMQGGSSWVFTRKGNAPNAAVDRPAQAREEAEAAKAREAAAEAERTARLNREVAERDAAIKRRNAETKAADERRQREYQEALAAQKAEAERIRREDAAAKARYEAEMAAWRARVAACNAGDYAQCQ